MMATLRKPRRAPEQRHAENLFLSLLVDVGVTYHRSLGEAAARRFLATQKVPGNVVNRILAKVPIRRPTLIEAGPAGHGGPAAQAPKA